MTFLREVQHAARRLIRDWRFTLAAALTLSLGIAANATVFTIVNALMLSDVPFTDHGHIVISIPSTSRDATPACRSATSRIGGDNAKSIAGMTMWGSYTWNVSDPGRDPDRYSGAYISANVFQLLRQKPIIGRDFTADDDKPGATPVVIFSHNVWQNRYAPTRLSSAASSRSARCRRRSLASCRRA